MINLLQKSILNRHRRRRCRRSEKKYYKQVINESNIFQLQLLYPKYSSSVQKIREKKKLKTSNSRKNNNDIDDLSSSCLTTTYMPDNCSSSSSSSSSELNQQHIGGAILNDNVVIDDAVDIDDAFSIEHFNSTGSFVYADLLLSSARTSSRSRDGSISRGKQQRRQLHDVFEDETESSSFILPLAPPPKTKKKSTTTASVTTTTTATTTVTNYSAVKIVNDDKHKNFLPYTSNSEPSCDYDDEAIISDDDDSTLTTSTLSSCSPFEIAIDYTGHPCYHDGLRRLHYRLPRLDDDGNSDNERRKEKMNIMDVFERRAIMLNTFGYMLMFSVINSYITTNSSSNDGSYLASKNIDERTVATLDMIHFSIRTLIILAALINLQNQILLLRERK